MSRKGGTGGGGWVHPKGANSMAVSGLVFRSDLVGTGRAISVLLLETSDFTSYDLHFLSSRPVFQLQQVGISQET